MDPAGALDGVISWPPRPVCRCGPVPQSKGRWIGDAPPGWELGERIGLMVEDVGTVAEIDAARNDPAN